MVTDTIRPEKTLLSNLDDVLRQMETTDDPDELATLFVLATELYATSQCVCESKPDGADSTILCQVKVNKGRDRMFSSFLKAIRNVSGR